MKLRSSLLGACLLWLFTSAVFGTGNPIAPQLFTADPAARVFGDRLYIYTSHDEPDSTYFDMYDWRLYSTADLGSWQDHGSIFNLKGLPWAEKWAWAPDAIQANGKYYLFLPVDRAKIGVAVGDKPEGPFHDAIGHALIDKATMPEVGPEPIDPAVLVDDDGQTYLFFGCRQLKVVKLAASLTKLAGPVQSVTILDPQGNPTAVAAPDIQPELPMSFGEAPFLFKREGKYYLVYSNGWAPASTLVYATGNSPTGPFTYEGEVMKHVNCVTHHGSVVNFKGKWVVIYHTSDISHGNTHRRNVCVDELTFGADGKIIPVVATLKGPTPVALTPLVPPPLPAPTSASAPIRVLIVDGYSNHDWKLTTALIRGILAPTGLFDVSVSTTPPTATSPGWDSWRPQFSDYDVVIQNYNDINGGPAWPRAVQTDFEDFVAKGGGVYIWHSANNAFTEWPAYNEMIGLGWRKKEFGPAIAVDDQGKVVTIPAGEGLSTGHGARIETVVKRLGDHPIHAGLPRQWLTPDIEVYYYARGPAKNMEVLSYGFDPRTKMNWPLEWTVAYGQGRVYTSTFGHVWAGDTQPARMRCAGVQTIVVRALQWLAKREITSPAPADFPTAERVSVRPEIALPAAIPPKS